MEKAKGLKIRLLVVWMFFSIILLFSVPAHNADTNTPLSKNAATDNINSDLRVAAQNGDLKEIKGLIAKGGNVNAANEYGSTALIIASLNEHPEVVRFLLSKGADINARDNHGYTAINHVAGKGDLQMVTLLIEKGADVNTVNDLNLTALDLARLFNNDTIANLLKKHGARSGSP